MSMHLAAWDRRVRVPPRSVPLGVATRATAFRHRARRPQMDARHRLLWPASSAAARGGLRCGLAPARSG
eukprot:scaffold6110_cov118-Isochrysis_galbana.AAC.9